MNKTTTKPRVQVKRLVFSAAAAALATITSLMKLFEMPMGGAITLFSMFFICLIGYWFGLRAGVLTGTAFGLLQLIIDPYIVSIPQMCLDYFLAFGALGLSGLLANRKHGLITGYILGVLGRYFFSFLSGVVFFAAYAPENMHPFIYSAAYNGSFLGAEAAITICLLTLPPVKKALEYTKKMVA